MKKVWKLELADGPLNGGVRYFDSFVKAMRYGNHYVYNTNKLFSSCSSWFEIYEITYCIPGHILSIKSVFVSD